MGLSFLFKNVGYVREIFALHLFNVTFRLLQAHTRDVGKHLGKRPFNSRG